MALPARVGRNSALRVAFLTPPQFQRLPHNKQQEFKRRALRLLMRHARYAVIEDSYRPDATFYVLPSPDGWVLRKEKRPQ